MFAMRKFLCFIALVIWVGIVDSVYAEQKHILSGADASSAVGFKQESKECVESIPVMRRYHMDLLFHQRDNTMYHGIRTKRYSLKGCIDCHVQKDERGNVIPINAADQFCQGCHQYVSANIDCFQCHASVPDTAR